MIEWLESIDRAIVLGINGANNAFFDEFFWLVSGKLTWIPLYFLMIFFVWKQLGAKKTGLFLLVVFACIALVDIGSVYLFKEAFQRYRPSHNGLLTHRLHLYALSPTEVHKGGMYGFVSSHAANFFAIATLVGLTLRSSKPKLIWVLFGVSLLVCYSRIYLGVHYLSDVFVGALWGTGIAYLLYRFVMKKYLIGK